MTQKKQGWEIAADVRPDSRQIKWQDMEFYGLISYGMNVFTGDQWGDGLASPDRFWPEELDVDMWAATAEKAGMSALLLTVKHIDGFCLWPTAYTDYSVAACKNWREGEGDIVRELSEACRRHGLKFGVFYSIWDKHDADYGSGEKYDDKVCGELTELLTSYGEIFSVWLYPYIGEGRNGRVQKPDLERYFKLIRELQPDCVISGLGPDVRWDGTDRGFALPNEWSVLPERIKDAPMTGRMPRDLGSRSSIKNDTEFVWYPLEISIPMRNHWFFTKDDNFSSKTKDKLFDKYYKSVGSNANFMLGLSPDRRGAFDETETHILSAFGRDLEAFFSYDLVADKGSVSVSSEMGDIYSGENVVSDRASFWRPAPDDKEPSVEITFDKPEVFDKLVITENIAGGQRVEEFEVLFRNPKGKIKTLCEGTTVGHKKIFDLPVTKTDYIKVVFKKFRNYIEITSIRIS